MVMLSHTDNLLHFSKNFFDSLDRSFEPQHIEGSLSPVTLAALLNQSSETPSNHKQLVIVEDDKMAKKLQKSLEFFAPQLNTQRLVGFDVSVYSSLYPNKKIIAQRLGWMHRAQNPGPFDLFIAPLPALAQKTLPFKVLHENTYVFKTGEDFLLNPHEALSELGYISTPVIEDVGTYSLRGGLIDIYSPAHEHPVRLELFGDEIHSLREFDEKTQRTTKEISSFTIIPAQEIILKDEFYLRALENYQAIVKEHEDFLEEPPVENLRQLSGGHYFHGLEFLVNYFFEKPATPLDHFSTPLNVWNLNPMGTTQAFDLFLEEHRQDFKNSKDLAICPRPMDVYSKYSELNFPPESKNIYFSKVHVHETIESPSVSTLSSHSVTEIRQQFHSLLKSPAEFKLSIKNRFSDFKDRDFFLAIISSSERQTQKLKLLVEDLGFRGEQLSSINIQWSQLKELQKTDADVVHIIEGQVPEGQIFNDERVALFTDDDILGKRRAYKTTKSETLSDKAHALSFAELKEDDLVVHKLHGVGIYKGLNIMPISGVDSEFIQIEYKDKDKLYLPIYQIGQIQKYSGPKSTHLLNKLGGSGWEKTKTKVKSKIQDLAAELLKLYAKRSQNKRPPYAEPDQDFQFFEQEFPYEETPDQRKSINDVLSDLCGDQPMDRLICGDVGFGKTEVAMRACFKAVQNKKQVAIIAPTTVLTFQHFQNFKKRFKNWPVKVVVLNRFVDKKELKKSIEQIKSGEADLAIGTHRLFSKDVEFNDLGLLVIDEEQRFGVKHKERIRRLKNLVDTLTLSATPIPRTLNLSLVGMRDLSLINTAPVDRLPTRTFICRFDKSTIKKAVESEISRGGQVFFLHNKVQSIYALADELKIILPNARIAVGHGQLPEKELEETMMNFFSQKIDVLVCTTIIESGIDIPTANTMFIDNAHTLGLSQLYQLRGRVGRSQRRAYCYLIIPKNRKLNSDQQERLRVIQENTELGSGIKIAHYDLELRGSGDILGQDQSGQINAVGYELYLELLENELSSLKGEPPKEQLDPELNLKIPALIPDNYISDIRIRLAYYKALSDIQSEDEMDHIEEELQDQFGKPPEPVYNLMGLMLIRKLCKDLSIRDLSVGSKYLSLIFTENTPLSVEKTLALTQRPNKKYTLTPESRLKIRINELTWPRVYDELNYLKSL